MMSFINNFLSDEILVLVDTDNKEWFIAEDIAKEFGYRDPAKAIEANCEWVKEALLDLEGKKQVTQIISPGDVFRLLLLSKLPVIVEFERILLEEVLPSIHKTGEHLTINNIRDLLSNPMEGAQVYFKYADLQDQKRLAIN